MPPSKTYTEDGIFPPPGEGNLSDYTILTIKIVGGGGGASFYNSNGNLFYNNGGNGAEIFTELNSQINGSYINIYVGRGGSYDNSVDIASGGSGGGSSSITNDAGVVLLIAGGGGGGGITNNGGDYESDAPYTNVGNGLKGMSGMGGKGGNNTIGGLNGIDGNNGYGGSGGKSYACSTLGGLLDILGGGGNGPGYGGDGGNLLDVSPYYCISGGGGGGYGGGGGGGVAADTGPGGGGGGGGNFINNLFSTFTVTSANNAGTQSNTNTDGYVTIYYTYNPQPPEPTPAHLCFLSDCDILLSDLSTKNITELHITDEVLGYLTNKPEKIKQIIKRVHFIDFLEDTNKPYLISKDSFAPNVPNKDIHLSGHHRVILSIEDNHFVGMQTFKLPNCRKERNNPDEIAYYHIILENRGVGLIVNNLPVEDCVEI